MTKEEAYEIVCGIDPESIECLTIQQCDAMHIAIQALQDELLKPSRSENSRNEEIRNLDEAARNIRDELYIKEGKRDAYGNPYFLPDTLMKAAIAGAEWIAGQGVKATATVGYYNQCGLSILTEPSIKKLGFKEGDELEITIRKK